MLEKQLPYKVKVYEAVKKEILNGTYPPGYVLNERRLSEELGISRTPVREAIQMLAQNGWVEMEMYKGAVVRSFDLQHMQDVCRIRSALEVCAVSSAIPYVTEADIRALRAIQQELVAHAKQSDGDTWINIDQKFHAYLYKMSRNAELVRLLNNYYDIIHLIGNQAIRSSMARREAVVEEHNAVVNALEQKNVEKAVAAMHVHMSVTEASMTDRLGQALQAQS